jgi:N-acetylglucosamine-6-phosphate deacetylase
MDSEMGPIDLQVNGYAGVDFNGEPLTIEQVSSVCERLRQDGVAGILATVITAPLDAMRARIAAICDAIDSQPLVAQMILGLHIEGPFINPETGYVGAHPVNSVIPADWDACDRLLEKSAFGHWPQKWTGGPT